jgi:hypothetical protein
VHGESLVGDRQFWVTRPYDWKKLVVDKALFVLTFINLPLFVLDVFLLAKSGFRPSSHVPGPFWLQLLLILARSCRLPRLHSFTAGLGPMLLALPSSSRFLPVILPIPETSRTTTTQCLSTCRSSLPAWRTILSCK